MLAIDNGATSACWCHPDRRPWSSEFPCPSCCTRTGRSRAVNTLEPLCESCHISASQDLFVVIIERCNVHTVWRRSAPLIVSIVWLLIKDYCPLQQGRKGLQGTPGYGMFDYALVAVSKVSSGVLSHLKTDILKVARALPPLVMLGSTGLAPVNAQPLCDWNHVKIAWKFPAVLKSKPCALTSTWGLATISGHSLYHPWWRWSLSFFFFFLHYSK